MADPIDTDAIRSKWKWFGGKVTDTAIGRDLFDALCEVDRLRAVVSAADEVWRCKRCGGGGMIAPGGACQTCAGDGVRVEWADDGSDLRPLIATLAALDADA